MRAIGHNPNLASRKGLRLDPKTFEGHRHQGNRDPFSRRKEHIQLPIIRINAQGLGHFHEAIRFPAHRGQYDHQLMPLPVSVLNKPSHVLDPFQAPH